MVWVKSKENGDGELRDRERRCETGWGWCGMPKKEQYMASLRGSPAPNPVLSLLLKCWVPSASESGGVCVCVWVGWEWGEQSEKGKWGGLCWCHCTTFRLSHRTLSALLSDAKVVVFCVCVWESDMEPKINVDEVRGHPQRLDVVGRNAVRCRLGLAQVWSFFFFFFFFFVCLVYLDWCWLALAVPSPQARVWCH